MDQLLSGAAADRPDSADSGSFSIIKNISEFSFYIVHILKANVKTFCFKVETTKILFLTLL